MTHGAYLGILALCLLGTGWLEYALRTRVYQRWIRLLLSVGPVAIIFSAWDLYAIASQHWSFDPLTTTGIKLPGALPIDEVLFFIVIPTCAILTLEAVRSAKGWTVGDEEPRR